MPGPEKPAPAGWFRRLSGRLSRNAWFATGAAAIAIVALALYLTSSAAASGRLQVICRSSLRSGQLTVSVDGKTSFSQEIAGSVKKRFGVLDKHVEGSFVKSVKVPAGEHVVQVRVTSAAESYDQTRQVGIKLLPEKEVTIAIGTQKSGLSIVYQGPPVAPGGEETSYFGTLRSVAVTVFGSAISAAIGFMVQEFLRSRKAR